MHAAAGRALEDVLGEQAPASTRRASRRISTRAGERERAGALVRQERRSPPRERPARGGHARLRARHRAVRPGDARAGRARGLARRPREGGAARARAARGDGALRARHRARRRLAGVLRERPRAPRARAHRRRAHPRRAPHVRRGARAVLGGRGDRAGPPGAREVGAGRGRGARGASGRLQALARAARAAAVDRHAPPATSSRSTSCS